MDLKKLIKSEKFWIFLMVTALYAFAYGPIIHRYQNPIPGRTYLGFNAFAIDPLGYAATIQQGYAGRMTRLPQATSAIPGPAFFVRTEYLLIGNMARILHIHPLLMLKIASGILSIFFILVLWKIIKSIFQNKFQRLTAFFFIFFATGVILPSQSSGGWMSLPIDSLVFQRLTVLSPHYMLSGLLTTLSVYFFSLTLKDFRLRDIIWGVIFGAISNHLFFPPMMLVYLGLGIYLIFLLLLRNSLKTLGKSLIKIWGYIVLTSLPLINLWYSSQFYDMNTYRISEKMIPNAFTHFGGYQITLGLVWILALLSIPRVLSKKNVFLTLSLCLVLVHPIAVFLIGPVIGMSQVRFFQTPYFVFMAITGTVGLTEIFNFLKNRVHRLAGSIVSITLVLLVISSGFFVYRKSLHYTNINQYDIVEFGYPYTRDYKAMIWLGQYCNYDKSALSDAIDGNLLLALTPCRVYMSDWVWKTIMENGMPLESSKNRFFAGQMSESEAFEFVRKYNIAFIYFGLTEQQHHHPVGEFKELLYPFLKKIYEKDNVVIYSTK